MSCLIADSRECSSTSSLEVSKSSISSNNCAVIHKSVAFFEELHGYPKICAVFGRTVRLFKNPSSFSKNCTDIRKSVRLFEYLSSSPKIRPVLQRSLKIAPLLFFVIKD